MCEHCNGEQLLSDEGIEEFIESLTDACIVAADQKMEAEPGGSTEPLEEQAHKIMEQFYNRPLYDSVIVLTSCLARVLQEARRLNHEHSGQEAKDFKNVVQMNPKKTEH